VNEVDENVVPIYKFLLSKPAAFVDELVSQSFQIGKYYFNNVDMLLT
jgi:hypothetical protein